MDVYGKITKPFWDDKPVAIVGGGPSLVDFDFERLRGGAHVLAIKSAIVNMPWADACFGMGDFNLWRDKLEGGQSRVYWLAAEPERPMAKNVTFLKRLDGQDVSEDPSEVYGGGTSGFGSMQVCLHKRARLIVLFGFDYDGTYDNGSDKLTQKKRALSEANWGKWARHFDIYVPHLNRLGISVVNACPTSSISCFQKVTLDDGVGMLK
jgi:hypothetical protein